MLPLGKCELTVTLRRRLLHRGGRDKGGRMRLTSRCKAVTSRHVRTKLHSKTLILTVIEASTARALLGAPFRACGNELVVENKNVEKRNLTSTVWSRSRQN